MKTSRNRSCFCATSAFKGATYTTLRRRANEAAIAISARKVFPDDVGAMTIRLPVPNTSC